MSDTPQYARNQGQYERGKGQMSVAQQQVAIYMMSTGFSAGQVARHFGVTRNTISGIKSRFAPPRPPTTLAQRLDAMHAKMDAVLAATLSVPRIPGSSAR